MTQIRSNRVVSALRHDARRCIAILFLALLLAIIAVVLVRLGFGQEQQRVVEITNVSDQSTPYDG